MIALPIIKDTPVEATLRELELFARKPENRFGNPEESWEAARARTAIDALPDSEPAHSKSTRELEIDGVTYKIAFTYTNAIASVKGKVANVVVRHATLGIVGDSRELEPPEAFTILSFLGFHGLPQPVEHPGIPGALVFFEMLTSEEEKALSRPPPTQ